MSVELNHTIIPAKDKWASAKFLADILNLEAGPEMGPFRTHQDSEWSDPRFRYSRGVPAGALRFPCQ
jgi:hypothetical protein